MKTVYMTSLFSILILLTGCFSSSTSSSTETSLRFTYWGGPLERKAIETLIDDFNQKHPTIEVHGQLVPINNYVEKMNVMAASKTLPDAGYFPEGSLYPWVENEMLQDLTPLLKSDQTEEKLDYTLYQFNDGPIAGGSVANEVMNLYYNKDLFEEAGVELPPTKAEDAWTWDEFVEVAKELTVDRDGRNANDADFDSSRIETYGVSNFTGWIDSFLYSNNGGFVSQDGKELLIQSPESIEVLQEVADLMYVHHVMPTPSDASTVPATDTAILTKRVAMVVDGQWAMQELGRATLEDGLNLGIGVLPYFQKNATTNYGTPIVAFETGKDEKHQEAVDTFLAFIMNPENVMLLINEGLWMPNEKAWYEDTDKINRWIDTPIHPAEYEEAVIDWAREHVVQNANYFWEDRQQAGDIIGPALDQLWLNNKTAEEVVEEDILPRMERQFGDKYEY
ncbi:ABC transporter substrate-binding protein [Alkalicoccobacillus gibsonii]|uniref:ABC transporter substrate-binding protein n=1 Tax=Alkalicoccobacillus gibsonii TaxID=79881 RepID=UPI0019317742|nr:sugar ABC transporter substrate-binding protein [Alkalicoccobacillus gibsonii]MBM0066899.1 sugar ABC transporter substrate-binding protein [Alkalicoccobacillus gibsonii]